MAIESIEVVDQGPDSRIAVDTEHYILIAFKDPRQLEPDEEGEGEVDVTIELSKSLVLANLSDEQSLTVGQLLSQLGEQFGYSQAKSILQGLYGAI